MTTSSGLESGVPSGLRATCGASAITRVWSRDTPLSISELAPARRMIEFEGEPDAIKVAWKPRAMASMATKTPTVPAMPRIETTAVVHRAATERTL